LGKWAAERGEELRKINSFVLGKTLTEGDVRQEFPNLRVWTDVVDQLYPAAKQAFLDGFSRRRWKQAELFQLMGDVRQIKGATLYDFYKAFRKASGAGRKRQPRKRTTASGKAG
jgi:hypothetical protein